MATTVRTARERLEAFRQHGGKRHEEHRRGAREESLDGGSSIGTRRMAAECICNPELLLENKGH